MHYLSNGVSEEIIKLNADGKEQVSVTSDKIIIPGAPDYKRTELKKILDGRIGGLPRWEMAENAGCSNATVGRDLIILKNLGLLPKKR